MIDRANSMRINGKAPAASRDFLRRPPALVYARRRPQNPIVKVEQLVRFVAAPLFLIAAIAMPLLTIDDC